MNYSTPLPPISELAALASNIQTETTAERKVLIAISIWEAAQRSLDHFDNVKMQISNSQSRAAQRDERVRETRMQFKDGKITLSEFLRAMLPEHVAVDNRLEIFKEFLQVPNPAIPEGVSALATIQRDGILEQYAIGFGASFSRWYESRKEARSLVTASVKSKGATDKQHEGKRLEWAFASHDVQTKEVLIENLTKKVLIKNKDKTAKRNEAKRIVENWISEGIITKRGKMFILGAREKK